MTKRRRKRRGKSPGSPRAGRAPQAQAASRPAATSGRVKTPLWQGLLLACGSVVLAFLLLEIALAIVGVEPATRREDPFVGFVGNVPAFSEETDAAGRPGLVTAENKRNLFNLQRFTREKEPGTYRIFCLGGSTTYGRPYDDRTSFAGWLREMLPVAAPGRRWEVINAGAISYASYRVAHLVEELVAYEPDLFIVYSGHNEFLEERTYGELRDLPGVITGPSALLAKTRSWTAMSAVLGRLGLVQSARLGERAELAETVTAKLDNSVGPEVYERDDDLHTKVIEHFRFSLSRVVEMARAAGAEVILVTPASNLKDCSPFKSQHSDGLAAPARQQVERHLAEAARLSAGGDWAAALAEVDRGLALDARYAELHYRRGEVLIAAGRPAQAKQAFERARDEDVCPLRAVSPLVKVVADVARDQDVPLVDFVAALEAHLAASVGHPIAGEELFLDHVHPTPDGNRLLALALLDALRRAGVASIAEDWNEAAIAAVTARVEASVDPAAHTQALVNLARVLGWAGKDEEAATLASRALASGVEAPEVVIGATGVLAKVAEERRDPEAARRLLDQALSVAPADAETHFKLGLLLLNQRAVEAAAAHLLFASALEPRHDGMHLMLGIAMAQRRRYAVAYPSVARALSLNPQNRTAVNTLERLRSKLPAEQREAAALEVAITRYPSGVPRRIVQQRRRANGEPVPSGLATTWYENGRVERLEDFAAGVKDGLDLSWDPGGQLTARLEYRQGAPLAQP